MYMYVFTFKFELHMYDSSTLTRFLAPKMESNPKTALSAVYDANYGCFKVP